ncbi:MAG TPA: hypothetical protein PLD59_02010 [Tepidisphaeraceae bacterium]|nr:hypothetical protein [Tepidisphaeraceae bacterium]
MDCRKTQLILLMLQLGTIGLVGCAESAQKRPVSSQLGANTSQRAWGSVGTATKSANYTLYSTMNDVSFDQRLVAVMEAALLQYRSLAPTAKIDPRTMECYVFANRRQWAEFTRQRTGSDAAIYLQINRGGFTVRDYFVAYYIGESGTFAVAAHEGWHQFAARHFKDRLPPFLEEGIATMFENIRWNATSPSFNLERNVTRSKKLRDAMEAGGLWSLTELASMHAGDVVGQPIEKIEAFYAQNWAFARFLIAGAGGKYRPAFDKMMADAVAGELISPIARVKKVDGSFNPRAVRPMLEHYLGAPLEKIDGEYQQYMKVLSSDAAGQVPRD